MQEHMSVRGNALAGRSWTGPQRLVVTALAGLMALLVLSHGFGVIDLTAYPLAGALWRNMSAYWPAFLVGFAAQVLYPAVRRPAKVLTYEMWVDVMHVLFNFIFYLTIFGAGALALRSWMIASSPAFMAWANELPYAAQVLIALWMFDFMVYWRHRLSHEWSPLWPVHAVHHVSHQVDVLTTHRLHFLEVMAGGVLVGWAAACCGLDPGAVALGFMIYLQYNHFIHTHVRIRFPGLLKYVLVSPFMHRWHHAMEKEAHNRNYAVVFAFHDWFFGTAVHPGHEPQHYGVDFAPAEHVGESYLQQQLYPFRIWAMRLRNRLRR